ncbi:periplasmic heavy metal sensor [Aestuariivirga sp.]|uniref:periplasmic heavy metal sensor n=1 Tax=Aestuariivirga sp. TaxID=2650926 RepID=UPI0039E64014
MSDTMTQAGAVPPPPPRKASLWHWVLVISLALNLLLVAAGVTRFVMGPPPMQRMSQGSYLRMIPRHFLFGLDRTRRDQVLDMLKAYKDQFRDGQAAARQAVDKLASTLEAEPYSETDMRAAMDDLDRNGAAQVQLATDATREFILKLTPEERKQLADAMRKRAGKWN